MFLPKDVTYRQIGGHTRHENQNLMWFTIHCHFPLKFYGFLPLLARTTKERLPNCEQWQEYFLSSPKNPSL